MEEKLILLEIINATAGIETIFNVTELFPVISPSARISFSSNFRVYNFLFIKINGFETKY